MVQQLVEDRLRVLQLTVFDRSLKELKERVEKIDNATKQQNALQHINTLQVSLEVFTRIDIRQNYFKNNCYHASNRKWFVSLWMLLMTLN